MIGTPLDGKAPSRLGFGGSNTVLLNSGRELIAGTPLDA